MSVSLRLGAENLSDCEKSVLKELELLGVRAARLRAAMVQGVRSPAIATYRILLHRALLAGGAARESRRASREVVPLPRTNKLPEPIQSQKSKTCVIL